MIVVLILYITLCLSGNSQAVQASMCYDCHYSPSGMVKQSNGSWTHSKLSGFHRCALEKQQDDSMLNKWRCASGKCFLRKDDNGLVFRGCADKWNLPWGINVEKNCASQGYKGSVWWFCDGNLCNNADMTTVCGDVGTETRPTQPQTHLPRTTQSVPITPPAKTIIHSSSYKTDSDETVHGEVITAPDSFLAKYFRNNHLTGSSSEQNDYQRSSTQFGWSHLPGGNDYKSHSTDGAGYKSRVTGNSPTMYYSRRTGQRIGGDKKSHQALSTSSPNVQSYNSYNRGHLFWMLPWHLNRNQKNALTENTDSSYKTHTIDNSRSHSDTKSGYGYKSHQPHLSKSDYSSPDIYNTRQSQKTHYNYRPGQYEANREDHSKTYEPSGTGTESAGIHHRYGEDGLEALPYYEFYDTYQKPTNTYSAKSYQNHDYHSKSTDYHPKSTDYHLKSTDYHPKSTDYHPKSTDYHPKSTDYHPKSTDYHPKSTDYHPKSTDYHPKSTDYHPKSTDYHPKSTESYTRYKTHGGDRVMPNKGAYEVEFHHVPVPTQNEFHKSGYAEPRREYHHKKSGYSPAGSANIHFQRPDPIQPEPEEEIAEYEEEGQVMTEDSYSNNGIYGQPQADSTSGDDICYDCNYAPSGYIVGGPTGWNRDNPTDVGFSRCALRNRTDFRRVDSAPCMSGVCFIRKEDNGLVYRGCGDQRNLPFGVKTDLNCKYQGPRKSLWWFCRGRLCNGGQIGQDVEHCASPPPPPGYELTPTPSPTRRHRLKPTTPAPLTEDKEETTHVTHRSQTPVRYIGAYNAGGLQRFFYIPPNSFFPGYRQSFLRSSPDRQLVSAMEFPKQSYRGQPSSYSYTNHFKLDDGRHVPYTHWGKSSYDPCKGSCDSNPSGLYADPNRADHFIQCGMGGQGNNTCSCCRTFYLRCPRQTTFDDVNKICVQHGY